MSIRIVGISVIGIHIARKVDSSPDLASFQIPPILLAFHVAFLIENSPSQVMLREDDIRVDSHGLDRRIAAE